jgi:hypothetical protein
LGGVGLLLHNSQRHADTLQGHTDTQTEQDRPLQIATAHKNCPESAGWPVETSAPPGAKHTHRHSQQTHRHSQTLTDTHRHSQALTSTHIHCPALPAPPVQPWRSHPARQATSARRESNRMTAVCADTAQSNRSDAQSRASGWDGLQGLLGGLAALYPCPFSAKTHQSGGNRGGWRDGTGDREGTDLQLAKPGRCPGQAGSGRGTSWTKLKKTATAGDSLRDQVELLAPSPAGGSGACGGTVGGSRVRHTHRPTHSSDFSFSGGQGPTWPGPAGRWLVRGRSRPPGGSNQRQAAGGHASKVRGTTGLMGKQ